MIYLLLSLLAPPCLADMHVNADAGHYVGNGGSTQTYGASGIMESLSRPPDPTSANSKRVDAHIQSYQAKIDEMRTQESVSRARTEKLVIKPFEPPKVPDIKTQIDKLKYIDLSKIPDPDDSELPFLPADPELRSIYKNLYKANPTLPKRRAARELGLHTVQEADELYSLGDVFDAELFKEISQELLDISVGLDPITGLGRSSYELLIGKNLVTGKELSGLDRGIAFAGVVTLGSGRSVLQISKSFVRIASRLGSNLAHVTHIKSAITYGAELLETKAGKLLAHIRREHVVEIEDGFKVFDHKSPIGNPLPSDGEFSRTLPRFAAEELQRGEGLLAVSDTEAFITAWEDIKPFKANANGLAEKLSLFKDAEATQLRELVPGEDVIVRFRFKQDFYQTIRSPIQDGTRTHGFVPGGQTKKNAREWIVDTDVVKKGMIDPDSIIIEEIL